MPRPGLTGRADNQEADASTSRANELAPLQGPSVDRSHPVPQGGPLTVAAFALIHGGGGSAWHWHLVVPSEDDSAGWSEYTDTVVRAVGDRSDLVVVGHSLGGFTAPLVCARLPAGCSSSWRRRSLRPASSSATGGGTAATRRPGTRTSSTRRPSRARSRGEAERTQRVVEGAEGAVAAHGLARDPDEVPPLPRRPHVPRRHAVIAHAMALRDDALLAPANGMEHHGAERMPPQCCRPSTRLRQWVQQG
jgi:pimeloyl-ACP methyl ester carboxylesterase